MHWSLYEDTLTKKHFLGNTGWGNAHSSTKVNPFRYLTLDRKELPKEMFIYGEINGNSK